ncbi:MAG TPA: ATP-binding protein [Bacillota bacterium]|nr:ATP-binding protein [Bacillota bacterium]
MHNSDTPKSHPTLIIIRGLPGSGKSHLATALCKELGEHNVVTLDPDATDYTSKAYTDLSDSLTAEGVDKKFHPYRFLRAQAYQGITGNKYIIWNQGFTNLDGLNKTVINLQTYATDHDTELPLLVVEVEIDHDIAKKRVADRVAKGGHDVNEENFARFINDYRTFAGEGYDPVVVNGEDEVSTSVATVLKALQKLDK